MPDTFYLYNVIDMQIFIIKTRLNTSRHNPRRLGFLLWRLGMGVAIWLYKLDHAPSKWLWTFKNIGNSGFVSMDISLHMAIVTALN